MGTGTTWNLSLLGVSLNMPYVKLSGKMMIHQIFRYAWFSDKQPRFPEVNKSKTE